MRVLTEEFGPGFVFYTYWHGMPWRVSALQWTQEALFIVSLSAVRRRGLEKIK